MSDLSILSDIRVDFETGRPFVDEATGDIEKIYGADVAIQNLGIRLNTQIGTVKRQGVDGFGWDKRGRIKEKISIRNIATITNKLTGVALEDPNVKDATIDSGENVGDDELVFIVNVLLIDGNWYQIPVKV